MPVQEVVNQSSPALHEFQRRHHNVGRAVAIDDLQSQHDLTRAMTGLGEEHSSREATVAIWNLRGAAVWKDRRVSGLCIEVDSYRDSVDFALSAKSPA